MRERVTYMHIHIHTYIHTYIERKRDRDRDRQVDSIQSNGSMDKLEEVPRGYFL